MLQKAQTKSLCYKKAQTKSLCYKKAQTKSLWQNTRLVFCIKKSHYHLEMILYSKSRNKES